jgi:hypothetical protein
VDLNRLAALRSAVDRRFVRPAGFVPSAPTLSLTMRLMRFAKMVGYVVLVTASVGAVSYFAATGVPALQAPVRVEDAFFLSDGGSFHIVVRGADGKRFAIGAHGSLDKPRAEFPLYTQRWWPYFPIPTYVSRQSKTEQELHSAVKEWLGQVGSDETDRMCFSHIAALLQERVASEGKQ